MKKTKLLLALCLAGSMANAQELTTNGGFESYTTLPTTCPTTNNLTDANSWSILSQGYQNNGSGCINGSGHGGVVAPVNYYNNSTGGNGSCEPISPHSGNGYATCISHGYNIFANSDGMNHGIYQLIGTTLLSAKKYLFTAYSYSGSTFAPGHCIPTLSSSSTSFGTAPTVTITGSGWQKLQAILTVPSDGSYYLVIGDPSGYCWPTNNTFGFAIDDVSLEVMPCTANAGSNVNDLDTICCGCATPGVQIGTASISGYSYSWSPSGAGYISGSNTVAQPTAIWCHTSSTKIYTVTVSGSDCATATSTVQVGTNNFQGSSCCRMTEGITGENQTATAFGVYPNPATGQVTISLYDKAEYIRITDMQGRLVFETKNIDAQDYKIDISKYNKGVYFISAKMGDKIEKQKLVVE
ncbi:MAG TPA: T9SS type A sorting domain-containing protein [Bacteroidia bacterium]|nr:T9SS type A sorting domain-containing protein [Bacteroidia bacterium]